MSPDKLSNTKFSSFNTCTYKQLKRLRRVVFVHVYVWLCNNIIIEYEVMNIRVSGYTQEKLEGVEGEKN